MRANVATIRKPHFLLWQGDRLVGTARLVRDSLADLDVNRLDDTGKVVARSRAVETAAHDLSGYGHGVAPGDTYRASRLEGAWRFHFGAADIPTHCTVTANLPAAFRL